MKRPTALMFNYFVYQTLNVLTRKIQSLLICRYGQMKTMACKYRVDFRAIFGQVAGILKQVHKNVKARINKLADDVDHLTGEARENALAAKREAEVYLLSLCLKGFKKLLSTSFITFDS